MARLPAVLDVRDDLERARDEADGDVAAEIDAVRDRLRAVAERDRAGRESVLDEIDNELLRLEERTTGEGSRRIAAARNRIRLYRESLSRSVENLTVLESTFGSGDREDVTPAELRDESASVTATVVNEGRPRTVVAVVGLYDDAGDQLAEATGDRIRLAADDQQPIEVETTVPADAAYYTLSVVNEERAPGGVG